MAVGESLPSNDIHAIAGQDPGQFGEQVGAIQGHEGEPVGRPMPGQSADDVGRGTDSLRQSIVLGDLLPGSEAQITPRKPIQEDLEPGVVGAFPHQSGNLLHQAGILVQVPALIGEVPGQLSIGFHVELP